MQTLYRGFVFLNENPTGLISGFDNQDDNCASVGNLILATVAYLT